MIARAAPRLKVLIVEFDLSLAKALAELLTSDGSCEIVGVMTSERKAIEWSLSNNRGFDVAVVDLLLADGSGFSVLAHLIKSQPGKVVIVSDYITPVVRERCLALGAIEAFKKTQTAECVEFVRAVRHRS